MIVGDPRYARLWAAAHRRLERSGGDIDQVSITLREPGDDERRAIDRLLGRRTRGRDLTVRLTDLDDVLRRVDTTLLEVVRTAVGDVRDRRGEQARAAAAEDAMWSSLREHQALGRHPPLAAWLDTLRASGRWRRLDDPPLRLRQALHVLAALPAPAAVSRSRLATDVLGPAHDLDDTAVVGRLVLAALAHLGGHPPPTTAAGRRRLWSAYGVTADETSSTALTVGLRPLAAGPVTEAARRWADSRTPLVVPLAAVEAEPWHVTTGTRVWICENPAVLAAAAPLEAAVVCVEGWPSLAATRLLTSLAACGARLAYHGDFGAGGIAIANAVIADTGADPWRMSVDAHAEALHRARSAGVDLRPLRGVVPPASWDDALAPAITAAGVEIEEELVLDLLVEDIRAGRPWAVACGPLRSAP